MSYFNADIDDAAKEVIQTLCDLDIPNGLAVAALCKAIVMIGTEQDLDKACKMIDDFAERSNDV